MTNRTMEIQTRLALPSDVEVIDRFDEFRGSRLEEIDAGNCFVAVAEGTVVAYASLAPRCLLGQPLLTFLCVQKAFRRQGIATSLVRLVQSQATGRVLLSSTEDWCLGTQRIFEHLGWEKVGQIAGVNQDGSAEWFYAIALGG